MTERAIDPAWHSRVVLVTGGTSGIGICIASALLDAGARVAIGSDLRAGASRPRRSSPGAPAAAVQAALLESVPLRRWGTPAEVAHMVLALLHPNAGFVTGALGPVDGGYLAH